MRVEPAFEAKLFAWCAHRRRRGVGPRPNLGTLPLPPRGPQPAAPRPAAPQTEPRALTGAQALTTCVCARCVSSGVTTITISHNLELRAHHTHELLFDDCGGTPQLKPLHQ